MGTTDDTTTPAVTGETRRAEVFQTATSMSTTPKVAAERTTVTQRTTGEVRLRYTPRQSQASLRSTSTF
jgi:hypothetical protein